MAFKRPVARRASLLLLLLSLTISTTPVIAEPAREGNIAQDPFPEAEAAIRQLMMSLDDIVNQRDWDALRALHLDSEKFTKFGSGSQRQGFDEMIAEEIAASSAARDVSIDLRNLKIDVFGDVAVATSTPLFSFTNAEDEAVKLEARSTMVWVNAVDGWKIAHEHNSPLDTP